MKKSLFVAGVAALALVACKKTETVDAAATTDSTEVLVDSTAIVADSAATVAEDAAEVATDAAN